MAFEEGNQEAKKRKKPWADAINRAVMRQHDGKIDYLALDAVADALVKKAKDGDVSAIKEIGDRLDGKSPQALTGEDGAPLIPETNTSDVARQIAFILAKALDKPKEPDAAS